jgi:hypothetical protein
MMMWTENAGARKIRRCSLRLGETVKYRLKPVDADWRIRRDWLDECRKLEENMIL